MKNALILCLLLMLGANPLFSQTATIDNSFNQRIKTLEDEKSLRERESKIQMQELQTKFDALKLDSENQGMRIWVAIFGGFGVLGISIPLIWNSAKTYAKNLVQAKLDKDLPPMVQEQVETSFTKLLRTHSKVILDMVGERDQIAKFKREKKILIYCEDEESRKKMVRLVKGVGFKHVVAEVGHEMNEASKYDLVVVAREEAENHNFEILTDDRIWEFYESLPEPEAFVYYGPRSKRLDSIPRERIHFTNIVFTLESRILEVFAYQAAMKV